MLAARRAGDARAAALPARRADQAARCARWPPRPGCRSPPRPSRRTSASSPAPARRAFLARHGGLERPPGRDRRPRGPRARPRTAAHHHFTVGQRKGLGVAAPEPLYVLAHRRALEPRGRSARARRSPTHRGRRARRPPAPRRRPRSTASSCATARAPCRAAVGRRARPRRGSSSSCASPSTAPRPGQTACLLRGDVVVGWGTIAPRRQAAPRLSCMAMSTDEIREQFLSFFEQRDHKRLPSFPLVPPASDTSTLLTIAGMQPLKPYLSGREQPPHIRLTDAPEGLPHDRTSRRSAPPRGT